MARCKGFPIHNPHFPFCTFLARPLRHFSFPIVLAALIGLLGLGGLCGEVWAFSFSVEPSRIELSVPAGKQRGKSIRVTNAKTTAPLHVKVYVQDLHFLPDGTSNFLPPGSTDWSCANWIRIIPDELDVPKGGSTEVRVSVAAPAGARGGAYAMVFFETGPSYAEQGVGVNFRIGALIQVTIPGTEQRAAKLAGLSVSSPHGARTELFNDGNVLIRPKGTLKIFDGRSKRIAQVEFNPDRVGVLPKTLRVFQTDLGTLGAGRYRLRAEIDYGSRHLLVGEHTFEVE